MIHVFFIVALVSISQQDTLTLKIRETKPAPDGKVVVTLASGAQITVAAADIETPPGQDLPTYDQVQAGVRAKCAKEWPDDFQLRAVCEKGQQDSLTMLRGRSMTSADEKTIRRKCAQDWPDDFQMRNVCETGQLQALKIVK